MTYKVGIVGESNYQATISRCAPGDAVRIMHEVDNPYDSNALVVVTSSGQRIGYIGKRHWLRDLIHEQGRSCEASIDFIGPSDGGDLGVVLNVVKGSGPVQTRRYKR